MEAKIGNKMQKTRKNENNNEFREEKMRKRQKE